METIKELANIISLQKLKVKDSKLTELYKLAKSGTDSAKAQEILFDTKKSNAVNFRRLKKRLINRMIQSIILTPVEGQIDYNSIANTSYLNYAVIRVLLRHGLRKTAIPLAIKNLKIVLKYELSELSTQLALLLTHHFSLTGSEKDYKEYRDLYQEQNDALQLESELGLIFQEASSLLSRHKKPTKEALDILDKIIVFESKSFQSSFIIRRAALIKAHIDSDVAEIMKITQEAFDYFDSLSFPVPFGIRFMFLNKRIPALILLQKFEEANNAVGVCEPTRQKGNINWHMIMLYKALNGFYSKSYTCSHKAFIEASQNMDGISNHIREQWLLVEAYLYFLSQIGELKEQVNFRLSKFLNELKVTYKDKRGANASALVIQMMILMSSNKKGELIDKSDTVLQYVYNYLKDDDQLRLNLMIRILREMAMSEFERSVFIEQSKEYLSQLNSTQKNISDLEIEILPFERCYEYMLRLL